MKNVTVYTNNQCPYCILVKKILSENNIPFSEVNVESNPEIVQLLVEQTGRIGVPQIEINGTWLVGYDPNKIINAINR